MLMESIILICLHQQLNILNKQEEIKLWQNIIMNHQEHLMNIF